MAKRKVNLDQGVVAMGDPEDISDGMIDVIEEPMRMEAEDADIVRDKDGQKQFIIVSKKIPDSDGKTRNVVRTRVPLTPGICDVCGTEIARNYSILSDSDKNRVKYAVQAHKTKVHYSSTAQIINEEQYNVPVQWPPKQ